jgi:hypothetical protein
MPKSDTSMAKSVRVVVRVSFPRRATAWTVPLRLERFSGGRGTGKAGKSLRV